MNSYIQLLCLILSFGYGLLMKFLFDLLKKILLKKNVVVRTLFFIVLVVFLAFLFVFVIYKINSGIINIYFYLLILFGYVLVCVKKRKM